MYKALKQVAKRYYKYVYINPVSLNDPGVVTSATGGNGWTIYTQPNYNEVFLMLNSSINPSYPRWQTSSPNVYAYVKMPKKGIISSYLTTQWCDDNATSRICNHWIIRGYQSEADLLALRNGTVIDDNTWSSQSKGTSKTVTLSSNTYSAQYYSIQMVSNFAGSSYCSMGTTRFYMKEETIRKGTDTDYDFYNYAIGYDLPRETKVLHYKNKEIASGYKELDKITSTGNQYILTGVGGNSCSKVELGIITPSNTAYIDEEAIFGSTWSASGFFLMFYQNRFRWHSGGASIDTPTISTSTLYNIVCTKTSLKINGQTYTFAGSGDNSSDTIKIFAPTDRYGVFSLLYMRMYDTSGTLIRDFVPGVQTSNSNVGLYNRVNDSFYTDVNRNNFIAGNYIPVETSEAEAEWSETKKIFKALRG